jgi:hypothetical protein
MINHICKLALCSLRKQERARLEWKIASVNGVEDSNRTTNQVSSDIVFSSVPAYVRPVLLIAFLSTLLNIGGCRKPPQPPSVQPPKYPSRVNVILDTSASMQGYFRGDTQLKSTTATLVSAIDKLQRTVQKPQQVVFQYSKSDGNLESTQFNSQVFLHKLLNEELVNGQDSLLDQVFQHTLTDTNTSDLSILITDNIFSYSSKDIRQNREVNKENIQALASSVQLMFNDANARGLSVSLIALSSRFHGVYYDYRNDKIPCCSEERPYYIWLFGTPQTIAAFRGFLNQEGFEEDASIDFAPAYQHPQALALQYADNRRTVYRSGETDLELPATGAAGDTTVKVALDLSRLPKDLTRSDPLQHFEVLSRSIEIGSWTLEPIDQASASLDVRDKKAITKAITDHEMHCTHILTVHVKTPLVQDGHLVLALSTSLPSWITNWSLEDDSHMDKTSAKKTYGLEYFVRAIRKAYSGTPPQELIDIRLKK